jgi:hypothetical protein
MGTLSFPFQIRKKASKWSVCTCKRDEASVSEGSFEFHITGIRNNFGEIRQTGTVFSVVVDELLGAEWTSARPCGNFSSYNMQLCFIPYVL